MAFAVTTRYVEILGMTVEHMGLPHSIRVWHRPWALPSTKRESQPIGLILLHSRDASEPRIPGRSLWQQACLSK